MPVKQTTNFHFKKSSFLNQEFVNTCDELVIEPEKEQSH
jgi:hypothetical protein